MSEALTKALKHAEMIGEAAFHTSMDHKAGGGTIDLAPAGLPGGIAAWQEQASFNVRYDLFRGWVYAAINLLASEGAGQPPIVIRLKGTAKGRRKVGRKEEGLATSKLTKTLRSKAEKIEMEILGEHPLIDLLERPNTFQSKWQFVYSFFANLCLTGWSYVVVGQDAKTKKMELYALPTTWVSPIHDPHPFARFEVRNPRAVGAEPVILERHQVGFAHLPNPADPLSAMAPAGAQMMAIRVDDHIQTSQEAFFRNGIFPSVVVTVGKMPFMDSEGRPVLTGQQRRQIFSAVKKVWGGVANYGQPAIVDGLIEGIERLSATQNEMGWDKSEGKVKTRILSAYAVHPFLLGENVSVGGYAQVAIIKERMYERVNTYLDMLSNLLTNMLGGLEEDKLMIGFEESKASDPQLRNNQIQAMRKNGDISRNEARAEAGYPPEEEAKAERSQLLETVGGMNGTVQIMTAYGQGIIQRVSAIKMLQIFLQVSEEDAVEMIGPEPPPGPPEGLPGADREEEGVGEGEEEEAVGDAVGELRRTNELLEKTLRPMELADDILEKVRCKHGGHDQSTHGSGGGGGLGGGESNEERDARRQRMVERQVKHERAIRRREKTAQKKADNAVENAEKNVANIKEKLAAAEERQAARKVNIEKLKAAAAEASTRTSEAKGALVASGERLAALRAKLAEMKKSAVDDVLKEYDKEVGKLEVIVKRFEKLNGELERIAKEAESL